MNKDSFIVYDEWAENCEDLSDQEFGQLMRAVFKYKQTGENPAFSDRTMRACWKPIKQAFDRTTSAYDERCKRNQENGKKGGRPKAEKTEKPNGFLENPEKPNGFFENPNDNDNKNDNENDNDNESSPGSDIASLSSSLISFLNQESGGDYKPGLYIMGRLRALMSEGYSEEDFREVIRKKSDEWRGSKMAAYLRPSTLFGNKFAEYLAAPDPTRSGKKSTEDLQKLLDEKTDSLNLIHSRLTEIGGVNMKDNYDEYNDLKLKAAHLEDEIANINERMGE